MFLTVATEVKSEFMLERFEDSPKDCDFMKKYSNSIIWYQKNSTTTNFPKFFDQLI